MVNKITLSLVISLFLLACSQPSHMNENMNSTKEEHNVSKVQMTKEEKNIADEQFLKSLENYQITEEDFLLIAKYVIETAKKSDFKEIDPILGKKERMYSKEFSDPEVSYRYENIPNYPEIEVYLKYRKENNKLTYISLAYSGSAGALNLKEYKLNILDQLGLKVIKKELPDDSNQIFEYQLTDGKFKYQVYGKDNIDNAPPKEFYIFRIYLD
ncbi:hypothetical protein [Acinetobacter sp. H1(2024)]|uniref:hypothetical protein n=1 Tax=Acinetobacter sp. H1(2024) TaxID=3390190 RepID=UPI00397D0214